MQTMNVNWRDRAIPAEMTYLMVRLCAIPVSIRLTSHNYLVREMDKMVLIMKSCWLVNQAILPDIDLTQSGNGRQDFRIGQRS